MKAYQYALDRPWAILPTALETILAIAQRETDAEAISAKLGDDLRGTDRVTIRDGVAVVPVHGPLFRFANLFTRISGATSMEMLAKDFRAALDDPAVNAVILDIDSPGGEVDGLADLGEQIFSARDSGKPIMAYISGAGASAAYWIASAAQGIVISPTGQAGSIGAVTTLLPNKADGRVEFVSSVSPKKRADLSTADGITEIQQRADALGQVFVETVARNRSVSIDTVLSDFGQGGMLVGQAAVNAGLADRLGTFEEVLSSLTTAAGQGRPTRNREGHRMSNQTEQTAASPEITAAFLKENHPEVVKELTAQATETAKAEGIAAGKAAEQARIAGIDALAMPGHEDLLAELKADGETTPEQASMKMLAAVREQGTGFIEAKKEAEDELSDLKTTPTTDAEEPPEFMALAQAHAAEHNISLAKAIKAVAQDNPELHKAYVQGRKARKGDK